MNNIESVKGHLIVSCQALPDEPLHSSFIMGRMARAAKWGGAKGIRANTVEDINEIQKEVDLPVIGIIKRVYGDCPVFITPTMKEIDELIEGLLRRCAETLGLFWYRSRIRISWRETISIH